MALNRIQASTSTRLTTGIDPSTPDGLSRAFAHGAIECLVAARELDKGFSDLTGEYIVTFHAIELGLKAFLIKHGMTETMLRSKSYRHDLVKLYGAARQYGMSLGLPDVDDLLAWINEWHSDGVKIRYEFASQRTLPVCATLFPLAEAIINANRPAPT
jgi:hypothetical protein